MTVLTLLLVVLLNDDNIIIDISNDDIINVY